MTDLHVEMHGELIGTLVGAGDAFDFVASRDAIRTHGLGSTLLSLAVPLVPRANPRAVRLRRNFFAELLPEADARRRLADEVRVRPTDVIGMLAAYGRDVAGALQIWDPSDPAEPRHPELEELDGAGVETMLREVAVSPLGNKPRRGKTSLNGVQSKIVLVHTRSGWARALDGYPSTHIVKPVAPRHQTMIFDEEYGSRFARALGLAHFDTHLEQFNAVTALVIERYDRDPESVDGRIHQEDFSQVLGLSGDQKYETYGGIGLDSIAKKLNNDDQVRLLRMITLSVALGNLDMHAKNVSLLHHADGSHQLASMYDVVPQTHEDNDGEMAFRIGGEFEHRVLSREHLSTEGARWGLPDSNTIVDRALADVLEIVSAEKPAAGAHPGLRREITRFTKNLIAGRACGDDGDGVSTTAVGGERAGIGGVDVGERTDAQGSASVGSRSG